MPPSQAVPRWCLALVALLGVILYVPTLNGGFLGDDFAYIARFYDYPWSSWPNLFLREWSEGLWGFQLLELRPTTALSFMIDARLYAGHPLGYRITNLALLLGSACLLMAIAWRASRGKTFAALAAGLLFVLHPIAVEPTTWITGRVDGLAALLALSFWLSADLWVEKGARSHLLVALFCLGAGIFGKEFCLLVPLLLVAWWLLIDQPKDKKGWQRRVLLVVGVVIVIGTYALCRQIAFANRATSTPAGWNDVEAWGRQVSYLGWLSGIFPALQVRECPVFLSLSYAKHLWICGLSCFAILLFWAAWRKRETLSRALFFTYFWYLGNTVTLLAVGYFSPRHLYFSSTGIALGAALLLAGIKQRWLQNTLLVACLILLGIGHYRTQAEWRTAGRQSAATMAAMRDGIAKTGDITPKTVLIVEISEVYQGAWLWSWAAPFPAAKPFLPISFAPNRVFTRTAVYYRPDQWSKDLKLTEALATADSALVVRLRPDGSTHYRRASASDLKQLLTSRVDLAAASLSIEQYFGVLDALLPP